MGTLSFREMSIVSDIVHLINDIHQTLPRLTETVAEVDIDIQLDLKNARRRQRYYLCDQLNLIFNGMHANLVTFHVLVMKYHNIFNALKPSELMKIRLFIDHTITMLIVIFLY